MSTHKKSLTLEEKNKLDRHYANCSKVSFNVGEFLIDFGLRFENEKAELYTGIITSPRYAKDLRDLLAEAIGEYEKKCGPIPNEQ